MNRFEAPKDQGTLRTCQINGCESTIRDSGARDRGPVLDARPEEQKSIEARLIIVLAHISAETVKQGNDSTIRPCRERSKEKTVRGWPCEEICFL